MDKVLAFSLKDKPNQQTQELLKESTQTFLSDSELEDRDVLVEYVVTLLSNRHPLSKVVSELETFDFSTESATSLATKLYDVCGDLGLAPLREGRVDAAAAADAKQKEAEAKAREAEAAAAAARAVEAEAEKRREENKRRRLAGPEPGAQPQPAGAGASRLFAAATSGIGGAARSGPAMRNGPISPPVAPQQQNGTRQPVFTQQQQQHGPPPGSMQHPQQQQQQFMPQQHRPVHEPQYGVPGPPYIGPGYQPPHQGGQQPVIVQHIVTSGPPPHMHGGGPAAPLGGGSAGVLPQGYIRPIVVQKALHQVQQMPPQGAPIIFAQPMQHASQLSAYAQPFSPSGVPIQAPVLHQQLAHPVIINAPAQQRGGTGGGGSAVVAKRKREDEQAAAAAVQGDGQHEGVGDESSYYYEPDGSASAPRGGYVRGGGRGAGGYVRGRGGPRGGGAHPSPIVNAFARGRGRGGAAGYAVTSSSESYYGGGQEDASVTSGGGYVPRGRGRGRGGIVRGGFAGGRGGAAAAAAAGGGVVEGAAPVEARSWVNKKLIPCKWGSECHHIACEYGHPERDAAAAAGAGAAAGGGDDANASGSAANLNPTADSSLKLAGMRKSKKFSAPAAS